MAEEHFRHGNHVSWNSKVGRAQDRIARVVTSSAKFKNCTVHASKDEPLHEINLSDSMGNIAMHTRLALTRLRARRVSR